MIGISCSDPFGKKTFNLQVGLCQETLVWLALKSGIFLKWCSAI
jgi:hypothetical protein